MKDFFKLSLLVLLFAFSAALAGCSGAAKVAVPPASLEMSAPVAPGFVIYEIRPDLGLVLPELPANWVISAEPTPALLDHLAEHALEDAARAGRPLTFEEALQRSREHFIANTDLMVLNTRSEAHLLFSAAAVKQDPSAADVARSARISAAGVSAEGWVKIAEEHRPVQVKGAQQAQYFTIDYTRESDEPQLFMGIVGYSRPYWFWLYANDHLQDPDDRRIMEKILKTFEIRVQHR